MDPSQQPNTQPQQPPATPQYPESPIQPPTSPQNSQQIVQPQSPLPYPPEQPPAPQSGQTSSAPKGKTNTLAIVGLILAFIAPVIGLILSIVALSQIKKKSENGSGLAIAGIITSSVLIIAFLLIIPALVLSNFSSVQSRAKDVERQTDINAMYGQIENYHNTNGYYPSLDQMNDPAFRSSNMPELPNQALIDPKGTEAKLSSTPEAGVYAYQPMPISCSNVGAPSNRSNACTTYTLTATTDTLLNGAHTYSKKNLTY